MEEAALRDYKHKDIKTSRDFTAKLYNNEALPDVTEKYEPIHRGVAHPSAGEEATTTTSKPGDIGARMYNAMAGRKKTVDPMLEPTGDEPDRWDKDYAERMEAEKPLFQPVSASGHGTKYHKPSQTARFWYEAKNDDGVSYYYNVTSGKSRWDKPHAGFISIAEQEQLEEEKQEKAAKKARIAEEHKAIHGQHRTEEFLQRALPDMGKHDPYGGGGWKKIQSEDYYEAEPQTDLGLPAKREVQQPVIDKTEEVRLEFHEKTVASMSDKYGLFGSTGPVQNTEDTEGLKVSKPTISFRKRKNMSVRERTGDD